MTTSSDNDNAEAKALGQALASLRAKAGLTQPQAAERFGIDSAAGWGKYETGKAPSIFRPDVQRRLVEAVNASVEDLQIERSRLSSSPTPAIGVSRPAAPSDAPRRADPAPFPGMVAVYGYAAGEGERIVVASGSEIRWIPMHPGQRGYAKIGAAEIVGESMYPRYKPREMAYFVFDLQPPRGDDVIVELDDGTAIIKEYGGRTADHLILREFYPEERTFDLPLSKVKSLHAVVGR